MLLFIDMGVNICYFLDIIKLYTDNVLVYKLLRTAYLLFCFF